MEVLLVKTAYIDILEEVVKFEKHSAFKYELLAECGARVLFDIEEFRFLDGFDENDVCHHLVLVYNENWEKTDILEFEVKDYYELVALYLSNSHRTLKEILSVIMQQKND